MMLEVAEERETLAHAADLARSANASLMVERDAASAAAAALDLELVDARDDAERLRAEKHAMQSMVACADADAAARHGEALSVVDDELLQQPGGTSVEDLDAMTAEMQRKRGKLDTKETEETEEIKEGEGESEEGSTEDSK